MSFYHHRLTSCFCSILIIFHAFIRVNGTKTCHSLQGIPPGWVEGPEPDGTESIMLRVGLAQSGADHFQRRLIEISTPGQPGYGQFMSKEAVEDILRASDEAHSVVSSWLVKAGIFNFTSETQWVTVFATVSEAQALLGTRYKWYMRSSAEQKLAIRKLRTLQYCIPDDVASHIDLIEPTIYFDQPHPSYSSFNCVQLTSTGSCNWDAITPSCLRDMYNAYTDSHEHEAPVAIASFVKEYARYSDLALFEERYAPYAMNQSFRVVEVAGGLNEQNSSLDATEANSDVQYMKAISAPAPLFEYSVGYGHGNRPDGFLDLLLYMLAQPNDALPSTISVSYGEEESTVPKNYAIRVCNMFGQLGARGVSVLFASGDYGVGLRCQKPGNSATSRFGPMFPASCPWVTSVGAIHVSEAASFSSGGFSEYFNRSQAYWQSDAVDHFLRSNGNRNAGYFNPDGRAFPDVSAQGVNLVIINSGQDSIVNGTSLSAPIFGGIIARANSARLSIGKSPLGFLNPLLYQSLHPALTDVVAGSTKGCKGAHGGHEISGASWDAIPGWDPATGLGFPDEKRFLSIALQIP